MGVVFTLGITLITWAYLYRALNGQTGDSLAVAPESYCRLNGGYSSVRNKMYAYTLVYQRA